MKVIDFEESGWFLLSKGDRLFLDSNCNHGVFGYSFLIELNEDEIQRYRQEGRRYLSELAHSVHYSAPIVANSKSQYKDRGVDKIFGDEVSKAIQEHHASK